MKLAHRSVLKQTLELGYDLEVMWGCEWKKRIRMDGDVGPFVRTFEENWYPKWPKDGSFFGLVRCDVRVPPN